jgi:hypothetical protein
VETAVDEELTAANTDAIQNIQNVGEELDEIHGARELVVAEVARAIMVRLAATAACFPIVENPHARVEEATDAGLIAIECAGIGDFDYRALFDLSRAENAELNTDDWLDI